MFRNRITTMFIWLALFSTAHARLIEEWSYDKLIENSDVVVIGTVENTKDWSGPLNLKQFADALEGRITTFKVESAFKGKLDGGKIELIHCRLKENAAVVNGPLLAEFRTKGRRISIEAVDGVQHKIEQQEATPQYLLFLKLRTDGCFEPVAGQIDSSLSVRKMSEAE